MNIVSVATICRLVSSSALRGKRVAIESATAGNIGTVKYGPGCHLQEFYRWQNTVAIISVYAALPAVQHRQ